MNNSNILDVFTANVFLLSLYTILYRQFCKRVYHRQVSDNARIGWKEIYVLVHLFQPLSRGNYHGFSFNVISKNPSLIFLKQGSHLDMNILGSIFHKSGQYPKIASNFLHTIVNIRFEIINLSEREMEREGSFCMKF